MPFDPYHLTPTASLNRVSFVAGEALGIPAHILGRTAFDLLSASAFEALMRERADSLELSAEALNGRELSHVLRECLASSDSAVANAAGAVVREYGRRLGYMIAILSTGDAESRAARPEWDESYWEHWASVRQVYVGGGLAWPGVVDAAEGIVREVELSVKVTLAPFAVMRPLIGAARALRIEDGLSLVLDFGQTATKRAIAVYERGVLHRLQALEPAPANRSRGLDYVAWMADTVVLSLPPETSTAGVCVSSYLDERQHPTVYAFGGRFEEIQGQIANLREWLAEEVSRRAGRNCRVSLFQDTTAAGMGLSPEPQAAIVMLGTALGVGFARQRDFGLSPLARDFNVTGRAEWQEASQY